MSKFAITSGLISRPRRWLLYGPEGIGKTTFAADLLNAHHGRMIDAEDGSGRVDCARYPVPASWTEVLEMVRDAAADQECGALGIDTLDAMERLCVADLKAKNGWASIESPGYGAGYKQAWEAYGELLRELDKVIKAGKEVICLSHAVMRKFEQPDQMGSYDRWELKLQNSPRANIAAMCKEWADLVLFATYETIVVTSSDKKTRKAAGGKRVIYTTHHPCWDAKNRDGLPEKMDLDYVQVADILGAPPAAAPAAEKPAEKPAEKSAEKPAEKPVRKGKTVKDFEQADEDPDLNPGVPAATMAAAGMDVTPEIVAGLPEVLAQAMIRDQIMPIEIQGWTAQEGYYPASMPMTSYDPDYLTEYLPSVWDSRIVPECKAAREKLPF